MHQLNSYLFFSSLITIYYDALHTRWFIGRCNKPPPPPYVLLGDIAKKSLSTRIAKRQAISVESDIAVIPMWTLYIVMFTISVSNIYRLSPVACCQLLRYESCLKRHVSTHLAPSSVHNPLRTTHTSNSISTFLLRLHILVLRYRDNFSYNYVTNSWRRILLQELTVV
jgi:hypothetical protein